MLLAPLAGLPLALLPAQILWVNLVTHGLPGLALGSEGAERDVMTRPPRDPRESVFARGLWQEILIFGVLTGLVSLGLGVWGASRGGPWQTMLFTSLALLQLGTALAARSERRSVFSLGLGTNRFLLWTVLGTLAVQLALPFWAPARRLLTLAPLSGTELAVVLAASTLGFWAIEAEKLVVRRWERRSAARP